MTARIKQRLLKSQANLDAIKRGLNDTPAFMKKGYGQRIDSVRKQLGIKKKDLATACKVSPQAVGQWIKEETVPRPESLYLLSIALNKPESYFRGERDNLGTQPEKPILPVDSGEQKLLPWLQLNAVNWSNLRVLMKHAAERGYVYPVIPSLEDGVVFSVQDESMLPEFKPDDKLVVDLAADFRAGDLVVIDCSPLKSTLFRKMVHREGGMIALVPANPDYETYTFPRAELGKTYHVVGVLDMHIRSVRSRKR